jgi:single-stranded DNA-binding protein
MRPVNQVKLEGKVTYGPELRYSARGVPIAEFRMSISPSHPGPIESAVSKALTSASRGGKWISTASGQFIDVIVREEPAEQCAGLMRHGQRVVVEGRLAFEQWELHGIMGSRPKIVATAVKVPEAPRRLTTAEDILFVREAVRPALERFRKRLKKMDAGEAASYLSEVVEPFIRTYNRHRKAFDGPQSRLWPLREPEEPPPPANLAKEADEGRLTQ